MLSVAQVHLDYLENGADIITTASYQVSSVYLGFVWEFGGEGRGREGFGGGKYRGKESNLSHFLKRVFFRE